MRKTIVCLIALCFLLSLPMAVSAAESGTCGEGITWVYENGTLTISGSGEMADCSGGAPWAAHKDSITTVIIGDGITKIGANAFQNYDNIRSVTFGSGLVEIGAYAFQGCDGLTRISLPSGFKVFGASSFESCKNLRTISCAGRCPRFEYNSMWDVNGVIYYPAGWPWKLETMQELEKAFRGRINFLASDGSDPEAGLEEGEETIGETTGPVETTILPTGETTLSTDVTSLPADQTVPVTDRDEKPSVSRPVPSSPRGTEARSGNKNGLDGVRIFWLILLLAIAVLAAGAAVILQVRQHNRRKRRRRSKK